MNRVLEYPTVYTIGALGYGLIEIIFSGGTHWTMLIAGGVCFTFIYLISTKSREPLIKKWIMGAAVITTVEFLAGAVVNIILGWRVWDYSHHAFNHMGQICLLFSFFWFLICIPAMAFSNTLKAKYFSRNDKSV